MKTKVILTSIMSIIIVFSVIVTANLRNNIVDITDAKAVTAIENRLIFEQNKTKKCDSYDTKKIAKIIYIIESYNKKVDFGSNISIYRFMNYIKLNTHYKAVPYRELGAMNILKFVFYSNEDNTAFEIWGEPFYYFYFTCNNEPICDYYFDNVNQP